MNTKYDLLEKQKWFVNLRLGMFLHFNSATFQFNSTEMMDWEFDHENKGEERLFPFDPQTWSPEGLDCRQWAAAAKSLGARFAVLTAKHHEGFCLWPTATTRHSVKYAKTKTDVVKEYFSAFQSEGIIAGLYFSMLDLTRQIGRRLCTPDDVRYTKDQLTELLTGYGEVPFLIIDGWQAHWGGPSYDAMPYEEIDAHVKSLQPGCMLLNISCEDNLDHTEVVFFENAAGQKIDEGFNGPGAACNILTDCWFWRTSDPAMALKPVEWAEQEIREANRRNATFLLNASPNTDGRIDENVVRRFKEIGASLKLPRDLDELPQGWKLRTGAGTTRQWF